MDETLYVITGPTAVGKTELSLDWAKEHNAEILSCDSLLVYRGMNIGTAKPTKAELLSIPHHMIDCVDPHESFSVKAYMEQAQEVVEDIHARGKKVLITGGSGFYLKSFYRPVIDNIPIDNAVVTYAMELYDSSGLSGLLDALKPYNPDGLGQLDTQNPRRVIKALQRCKQTGKSLAVLREQFEQLDFPFKGYKKHTTLLDRPREEMHARARLRASQMLDEGLIDEVESLIKFGIDENPSAANAIGYRETLAYFSGKIKTKEELLEAISVNTQRLIRKQCTWFNKQIPVDLIINI